MLELLNILYIRFNIVGKVNTIFVILRLGLKILIKWSKKGFIRDYNNKDNGELEKFIKIDLIFDRIYWYKCL